jgi:hypothetical protein
MTRPPPGDLPDFLREPRRPLRPWVRLACLLGALAAFAAGIVGWLVPVVTGLPMYTVALVLLGLASGRARRWINRSERALPPAWRRGLRRAAARLPSRVRALFDTGEAPGGGRPGAS